MPPDGTKSASSSSSSNPSLSPCRSISVASLQKKRYCPLKAFASYSLGFVFLLLVTSFRGTHSFVRTATFFTQSSPSLHRPSSSSITTTAIMGIKGFRSWFESQFPDAMLAMPKEAAREEFDHVLIDMNSLLHIALRRSRSEGHALTLLMKEIDACCDIATPKASLVLAMDGPPSAAKLATQRRRRFSVVVRSEWKQQQLSRFRKAFSKREQARRKIRYTQETKTLCITPGTAFMERAQKALLYWAWQRLQNPNHMLANVKIFISSSNVHGEGEVKLLDWILQKQRHGESIAIVGGDSDLVLEGLVIPPSSATHNIYIMLPDGNKRYLAVSLWETTRALAKFLPKLNAADMMRVRTDLVLLLILNGNDYLPKLRGSSGFNKVFHTYLRLLHQWLEKDDIEHQPFLVDPDTLDFNLHFCVAFFGHMANLAPPRLTNETLAQQPRQFSRETPLGQLNNLVESAFLPQPVKWTWVTTMDDEEGDEIVVLDDDEPEATLLRSNENDLVTKVNGEENGQAEDDTDEAGEQVLMRLSLGKRGTDEFYMYEVWHDVGTRVKKSRQRLASMALDDLMGTEFEEGVDEDDDDEEEEEDEGFSGIAKNGYAWEVQCALPGNVTSYLGGLLWNLQTYQDGVCSDYAYNYGRRMSPMANDIVDFFKAAIDGNRTVGRDDLLGHSFSHPVSAGLSCLAALPSQVRELIPEPYSWLDSDTVEELYGSCMNPEDNVFDMKRFERLCEERIQLVASKTNGDSNAKDYDHHGRRVLTGDHYWTVLSRSAVPLKHPFDPPPPFSDRLSALRPNRRIKVTKSPATIEPRPRSVWSNRNKTIKQSPSRNKKGKLNNSPAEVKHCDMGNLLKGKHGEDISILDVDYMLAYEQARVRQGGKKVRRQEFNLTFPDDDTRVDVMEVKKKATAKVEVDLAARMREFKLVPAPTEPLTNVEGQTALELLNHLKDARMIGSIDWNMSSPSNSTYASVSPDLHECVQLTVKRGAKKATSVINEDLIYEQDRHINYVSRQALKQHLASSALRDLVGPHRSWCEMKFDDLKAYLKQKTESPREK